MKSECIHHFREDWLLWRTFSIGKWRVNVFKATSFREDFISEKIGYSVERFRSGNEEWMHSSFQRRLVTLENVFDWEMKSECIQSHEFQRRLHFREDWLLCRTFSIGKWRVNEFIISEKIGSGERFRSGNDEWIYSSFQRRLALDNVFDREKKSECIQSHFKRPLGFQIDLVVIELT